MLIAGRVIFSLFIGVIIGICIEKTANHLAAQEIQNESEDNYYYDANDDFYYTKEYINVSQIDEENHQLIKKF